MSLGKYPLEDRLFDPVYENVRQTPLLFNSLINFFK